MALSPERAAWFSAAFAQLGDNVERAIRGKRQVIEYAVTCLLTGGHLLLEDVPGTGKTQLARSLSNTVAGTSSRIQFTPDLLPSDVTGVTIYSQATGRFDFHRGPVFSNILLADEINRASPKTQSALLEVMDESAVTVDGVRHAVEPPFMVVATMNPVEQAGTYSLPEAQLDRFLMKTSLGHPDRRTTVGLLSEASIRDRSQSVEPRVTPQAVVDMIAMAETVHVDPAVLDYVVRLAEGTRADDAVELGVSVRGCLALTRCAKTWAAANGRTEVIPEDVKQLATPVFSHRILLSPDAQFSGVRSGEIVAKVLAAEPPPVDRGSPGP